MTEELKAKLKAAKTSEEVVEILKAHKNELTPEDIAKLTKKAKGTSGELSEADLENVAGGIDWDEVFKTVKEIYTEVKKTMEEIKKLS